jgi:hypothetical protein
MFVMALTGTEGRTLSSQEGIVKLLTSCAISNRDRSGYGSFLTDVLELKPTFKVRTGSEIVALVSDEDAVQLKMTYSDDFYFRIYDEMVDRP